MPKSFSEPDGNQLTPGPDDNLATGNESVDGCVNDDCSIYSPSNIVLKKILKVMMKIVIHLKKETIHCF